MPEQITFLNENITFSFENQPFTFTEMLRVAKVEFDDGVRKYYISFDNDSPRYTEWYYLSEDNKFGHPSRAITFNSKGLAESYLKMVYSFYSSKK